MKSSEVKKILKDYIAFKRSMSIYIDTLNRHLVSNKQLCVYDRDYTLQRIDRANDHLQKYEHIIRAMIDRVPVELHQRIMLEHYIDGTDWQTIADRYYFHISNVFKINHECIEIIAAALKGVDVDLSCLTAVR